MNRIMVATAALAASLAAAPALAQGDAQAPPADPSTGALPEAAPPPGAAPDVTPGPSALPLPSGDAVLPPVTEATPAPAPEAAPPPAQSFTDLDVTNFARAIIAIEPIRDDATLDETQRQARMGEALAEAGIAVETFNAMVVQSRTDAALKARIQTQIAALQAAQPPAA